MSCKGIPFKKTLFSILKLSIISEIDLIISNINNCSNLQSFKYITRIFIYIGWMKISPNLEFFLHFAFKYHSSAIWRNLARSSRFFYIKFLLNWNQFWNYLNNEINETNERFQKPTKKFPYFKPCRLFVWIPKCHEDTRRRIWMRWEWY